MKKLLKSLLLLCASISFTGIYAQTERATILFESDVHGATNGYAVMAGLRDSLSSRGKNVILVSCGDFSSGDYLSGRSKGESIVEIINRVGYDVIVPGNHEFDWGVEHLIEINKKLEAPMVCCNFFRNDSLLLPPYHIVTKGKEKIAFIGIVTPSTKEVAAPLDFKNAREGYRILGGQELSTQVQKSIDEVRSIGADQVLLLCHLGEDDNHDSASTRLINSITGVTAVINGHDHKLVDTLVKDATNRPIRHIATNNGFDVIGLLTITGKDKVSAKFLSASDLRRKGVFKDEIDDWVNHEKKELPGETAIGYSYVKLKTIGTERNLSRIMETNCGDFVADAFLHEAKKINKTAKIAIVNAGSIRNDLDSGLITEESLFNVVPFPNRLCLVELSGKEIGQMLEEMVASWPPKGPQDKGSGSFPQVSGIRFNLDSNAATGDKVKRLQVQGLLGWRAMRPTGKYIVATTDFILYGGDGIKISPSNNTNSEKRMYDGVVRQYLLDNDSTVSTQYCAAANRIVISDSKLHASLPYYLLFAVIAVAIILMAIKIMAAPRTKLLVKITTLFVGVAIVAVSYYLLCYPMM